MESEFDSNLKEFFSSIPLPHSDKEEFKTLLLETKFKNLELLKLEADANFENLSGKLPAAYLLLLKQFMNKQKKKGKKKISQDLRKKISSGIESLSFQNLNPQCPPELNEKERKTWRKAIYRARSKFWRIEREISNKIYDGNPEKVLTSQITNNEKAVRITLVCCRMIIFN